MLTNTLTQAHTHKHLTHAHTHKHLTHAHTHKLTHANSHIQTHTNTCTHTHRRAEQRSEAATTVSEYHLSLPAGKGVPLYGLLK